MRWLGFLVGLVTLARCAHATGCSPELVAFFVIDNTVIDATESAQHENFSEEQCTDKCRKHDDCQSFLYDHVTFSCSLYSERSKPEGAAATRQKIGKRFFEKFCLPETVAASRCARAQFIRADDSVLIGYAQNVTLVDTVGDCVAQCVTEKGCKSAMYFYEEGECITNTESALSKPSYFTREKQEKVIYFQNGCISTEFPAETTPLPHVEEPDKMEEEETKEDSRELDDLKEQMRAIAEGKGKPVKEQKQVVEVKNEQEEDEEVEDEEEEYDEPEEKPTSPKPVGADAPKGGDELSEEDVNEEEYEEAADEAKTSPSSPSTAGTASVTTPPPPSPSTTAAPEMSTRAGRTIEYPVQISTSEPSGVPSEKPKKVRAEKEAHAKYSKHPKAFGAKAMKADENGEDENGEEGEYEEELPEVIVEHTVTEIPGGQASSSGFESTGPITQVQTSAATAPPSTHVETVLSNGAAGEDEQTEGGEYEDEEEETDSVLENGGGEEFVSKTQKSAPVAAASKQLPLKASKTAIVLEQDETIVSGHQSYLPNFFSEWTDWTVCTRSGERRVRRRKCLDLRRCVGRLMEVSQCPESAIFTTSTTTTTTTTTPSTTTARQQTTSAAASLSRDAAIGSGTDGWAPWSGQCQHFASGQPCNGGQMIGFEARECTVADPRLCQGPYFRYCTITC